jgi:hypothetical protein
MSSQPIQQTYCKLCSGTNRPTQSGPETKLTLECCLSPAYTWPCHAAGATLFTQQQHANTTDIVHVSSHYYTVVNRSRGLLSTTRNGLNIPLVSDGLGYTPPCFPATVEFNKVTLANYCYKVKMPLGGPSPLPSST